MRKIAKQYPNSVYTESEDAIKTPCHGCIMSLAIKDLDPDTYEKLGDMIYYGSIQWMLKVAYGINSGTKWLEIVQTVQNKEVPWSECIKIADELEKRGIKNE